MAKKTCIHFDPVKPGCEIHNWRLKELDYVIKDLTPNNEHWIDPRYEGKSLADIRKEIAERYQATVGQKMQAKAAPIREAPIVIKPETTMADLQLLAKQLEKEFGIKCIQIHIHRDEGFNKTNPDPSNLNLHAHFVADWTHDNGTSLRLGRQDTSKMLTIGAECLKMERGSSSNVKHLNAIQYKEKKALENIASLRKLVYKSFLSQNAKKAFYDIRREFSRPEKRSAALSLIENTIFGYIKLYASSTFVPSSNGDNNPRKRRNYDDIDDMNDEERKGMAYK